jgi:hypothetical protein
MDTTETKILSYLTTHDHATYNDLYHHTRHPAAEVGEAIDRLQYHRTITRHHSRHGADTWSLTTDTTPRPTPAPSMATVQLPDGIARRLTYDTDGVRWVGDDGATLLLPADGSSPVLTLEGSEPAEDLVLDYIRGHAGCDTTTIMNATRVGNIPLEATLARLVDEKRIRNINDPGMTRRQWEACCDGTADCRASWQHHRSCRKIAGGEDAEPELGRRKPTLEEAEAMLVLVAGGWLRFEVTIGGDALPATTVGRAGVESPTTSTTSDQEQ